MNISETSLSASLLENSAASGLPQSSVIQHDGNNLISHNTQMLRSDLHFMKGINFNGDAVTINGNRWLSHHQAINDGLVIGPSNRYATDFDLSPTVDQSTGDMLNTGLEASSESGSKDLLIRQPLANGDYQVDLWVMSPTKRDRTFDVELEGVSLDQVTASGKEGQWQKYSYTTTVRDGQLDLLLDKVRKSPVIAGVEFSSVLETDSNLPSSPSDPASGALPNDSESPLPTVGVNGGENLDENGGKNGSNDDSNESAMPSTEPTESVGTPPVEPPQPSPTGGSLVWQNNFSGNWEQNWPNFQNTTAPDNRRIVWDGNEHGDILRISYLKGVVGPRGGTQFKSTFEPMTSATLEYDIRFKEGFDPALGGKLPGFTGGLPGRKRENTGGNTPDGTDGWSVRLGFRPAKSNPDALAIRTYSYLPPGQQNPSQNNEYVYDAWGNKTFWSGKGKWGLSNHFLNPDNPEAGKDLEIQTGKWYTVSLQVTLNTPGKTDGFIKGFIKRPGTNEPQLALHVPNLKFRNTGSELPIDRVFFSTFFGGSSDAHKARRDEHIDFDNFKVYANNK